MAAYADETGQTIRAANLMKRSHRRLHFLMWALLGPIIFATVLLAVMHRPAEPVNEVLPDTLIGEVR